MQHYDMDKETIMETLGRLDDIQDLFKWKEFWQWEKIL
jgi:hypothetical protein